MTDVLRIAVVTGGIAVLVMAVATVVLYYLTWVRKAANPPSQLISLHVWTVAISYLCFLAGAMVDMVQRLHEPITFRLPLYAAGLGFGVFGLVVTAHSVRSKAKRLRGKP